jgi:hypothetical protein
MALTIVDLIATGAVADDKNVDCSALATDITCTQFVGPDEKCTPVAPGPYDKDNHCGLSDQDGTCNTIAEKDESCNGAVPMGVEARDQACEASMDNLDEYCRSHYMSSPEHDHHGDEDRTIP